MHDVDQATARTVVRTEKTSLILITVAVVGLNVIGWGMLILVIAPRGYTLGSTGALGVGLGLTVFLLGARHAFDADHIAAIDNTTRKLIGDDLPATGVGFWFALGHSSVVFALALLIALGVNAVAGPVRDSGSGLQHTLGIVGPAVAGTFLVLVGTMNLIAAISTAKVLVQIRAGRGDDGELDRRMDARGLLTRIFGRLMRRVSRPWHMYPIGLLMGLGFDTATQVALLVLAAGSAAFTLPWYAILVLPVLFAAGMTVFDTADGVVMARAYRWAFINPVRTAFYNLTVTLLSVLAALGIGALLLVQLLVAELTITGGPLAWAAALDLEHAGYALAGLLVTTWLTSAAIWRFGRIEERWKAP